MDQKKEFFVAALQGVSGETKSGWREAGITADQIYNIEEMDSKTRVFHGIGDKEAEAVAAFRKSDWERRYELMQKFEVRLIIRGEADYPYRLYEQKGMPYALFARGTLPERDTFTAAIVGARRCTRYGEEMTMEFASALAESGVEIISGMALGIDGAAHRGALNVGGHTTAILGCSAEKCYPREHMGLYEDIRKKGLILSEYPPDTPPLPAHFPARNRLISGMADIVLVMEAKAKSGSLITADMALEQGKDIYALPGPITSVQSLGCHELIQQGAGILVSPEKLLEELAFSSRGTAFAGGTENLDHKIGLAQEEKLVYSALDLHPITKEQLIRLTGLAPEVLVRTLIMMEIKGYIEETGRDSYVRSRRK